MPGQVGNWVGETTATTGTGAVTPSGAITGLTTLSTVPDGLVRYAIHDGNDKEAGTGTLSASGTLLTRTTVSATLVSGVYDDTSPTAINLSGTAEVYCTFNKAAFDELASEGEGLQSFPSASGAIVLDLALGVNTTFDIVLAGNVTGITTTNEPTGSKAHGITMRITSDGTSTVVFGSQFIFPGGTPPTLTTTSGNRDYVMGLTIDNGLFFDCDIGITDIGS